ncbi:TPA: hypothetical protein ACGO3Q_000914 [Streptococcus suis]
MALNLLERGGFMFEIDQETLDYFYEELESYYDGDEQGEIFDGLNN